jgi:hypothetical protein
VIVRSTCSTPIILPSKTLRLSLLPSYFNF